LAAAGGTDLERVATTILQEVPDDLARSSTTHRFHALAPTRAPRCAAIDGGSTVVLDVKTAGLYCVRAGYVIREPDDKHLDRTTTRNPRTVTRRTVHKHWDAVRQLHGWGVDVPIPHLENDRIVPQLAEAERILAEYDACRRALHELHKDDLLLVDGSLEDEERYSPLRESLIDRARDHGVNLAGVSKDSSLSLGGVLPFTYELEEIADQRRIATPWWVDVTDALGRSPDAYRILCVRLDARSPAFRVDIGIGDPERIVAWLAELSNDPVFPGYPYPLARVHQRVAYSSAEAIDLRRDLEGIVARARGYKLSLRLFGRGRDVLALAN
jgi:hypothetical protein